MRDVVEKLRVRQGMEKPVIKKIQREVDSEPRKLRPRGNRQQGRRIRGHRR